MDFNEDLISEVVTNFDKLVEPKFSINNVEFSIVKLTARQGFELFENMRYAITSSASMVPVAGEEENAAMFIKTILALHPDTLKGFMKVLFTGLEFKSESVEKGWLKFVGLEDMAMETLQPLDIYELFVRCLIVNFTESFRAYISRLPGADRLLSGLKLKTYPSS